jgi:hypothetical protein
MRKFLKTGNLNLKAFLILSLLALATPNIVWGKESTKSVQPCSNSSSFYPKCTEEELFAPAVLVALRVIAITMTIKVGEDVLVGWLANKYGDMWNNTISMFTKGQLEDIAVTASNELRNISLNNGQRVSIDDYIKAFK